MKDEERGKGKCMICFGQERNAEREGTVWSDIRIDEVDFGLTH